MSTETKLHEVIERELEVLDGMEVGTEQYKIAVDGISKLISQAVDIDKFNLDADERAKSREQERELKIQQMSIEAEENAKAREQELDLKRKQLRDENIDKIVKHGFTLASITIGTWLTIWGTVVSMKFEKDDTFTSLLGREWVKKTFSFVNKKI